jgi:hypothetical protein
MNAVTAALDRDPLFTPKTVAARYGLTVQTLANMRCARRGPRFVKTPYGVRYRLSDLADWERTTFRHGAGGMATAGAA